MKSKMLPIVMFSLVIALACACSSAKPVVTEPAPSVPGALQGAPAWVLDPSVEGGIAAVGSAPMSRAGFGFSRDQALAKGRDELARVIQVKVTNMLKSFTETTGVGESETVDKVATDVTRQLAKQTLSGTHQKGVWVAEKPVPPATVPEVFVWVVLDPNMGIADLVKKDVMTSMGNQQAMWQKFQAKKAFDELDKEVEKEFGAFKDPASAGE